MSPRHVYAGAFLVVGTDPPKLVGQLRDDLPSIDNPGRIGPFGGSALASEDPRQAVCRELGEETNLDLRPEDLRLVRRDIAWRALTTEWEERHVFAAAVSAGHLETLEVHEGRGWAGIDAPDDPRLIDSYRTVVAELLGT